MAFRVTFVTGVTPDKWARSWRERFRGDELVLDPVAQDQQLDAVRDGSAAMAFVRLPIDRDGLHLIPLYREVAVVVANKDHPIAAFDELSVADLADEHLLQDPDTVPEWREVATEVKAGTRLEVSAMTPADAIATAASGAGIVIVPMSVARNYHRKDAVFRPVIDLPETQIGLAWSIDNEAPMVQSFIGIVRGRTERSSRT